MELYFRWPNRRSFQQFLVVVFLLLNLGVIVVLWRHGSLYYLENPAHGNLWRAIGRLAGLLTQYLILLQLLLIGRVPLLERPFGFDKLNGVHRWIGYSVVLLLLSHPLLLTIAGAQANNRSLLGQFAAYLDQQPYVLLSFLGAVLFLFIITISIALVRRKVRYESWYLLHLLTYGAIALVFLHQLHTGDLRTGWPLQYWYALNYTVFGLLIFYRFLRPLWRLARHRFRVARLVPETADVLSVYITGHGLEHFPFRAGQYANLRFLSAKHWWQSHPFSFSAGPNGSELRFSIKALGDYTRSISALRPGTLVLIDGPLGQFTVARAARRNALLIAGGIGITPIRALAEELAHDGRDTVLLYANRSSADIALRSELESLAKSAPLRVVFILGKPETGYESGFIDHEKIVRLVPDFVDREVFLCGPPPMMRSIIKELKRLGFSSANIHYERFGF